MKSNLSKGQLEDRISKSATKFYYANLGIGPKETRAYILDDLIIVRFKGKLLPIEEKILKGKGGISIVKNIKNTMIETFAKYFSEIIEDITGCKVISTHGDISTRTGERIEVFVLDKNFEEILKGNTFS